MFIKLRHDFLARGDTHSQIFKRPTYLRKYQNTCIVECVPSEFLFWRGNCDLAWLRTYVLRLCLHRCLPESHRSDTNLKDVFESLFPREIEHAEMLIDSSKLEEILHRRQALLVKYDNIDAKYRYERWLRKNSASGSDPVIPTVRSLGDMIKSLRFESGPDHSMPTNTIL